MGQIPKCADLVGLHQTAVAGDVSRQYSCKPPLHPFSSQKSPYVRKCSPAYQSTSDVRGAVQTSPVVTLNTAAAGCPTNQAADAPTYNPAPWNIPTVQPYNNCYNYANNNPTNTFAQPGRASGHPAATMACGDVQPAAISDGLRAVANFSSPLATGNGWYVALVVWPGRDYHWYRQDTVGCWSHKPGQTAVRNVDNAGKAISDPKSCDRGPYTDFCSYMVTKRGIVIS